MDPILTFIINHVFLPPQLPQDDDHSPQNLVALIRKCLNSLTLFQSVLPLEEQSSWDPIVKLVNNLLLSRDDTSRLSAKRLESLMATMNNGGTV